MCISYPSPHLHSVRCRWSTSYFFYKNFISILIHCTTNWEQQVLAKIFHRANLTNDRRWKTAFALKTPATILCVSPDTRLLCSRLEFCFFLILLVFLFLFLCCVNVNILQFTIQYSIFIYSKHVHGFGCENFNFQLPIVQFGPHRMTC